MSITSTRKYKLPVTGDPAVVRFLAQMKEHVHRQVQGLVGLVRTQLLHGKPYHPLRPPDALPSFRHFISKKTAGSNKRDERTRQQKDHGLYTLRS